MVRLVRWALALLLGLAGCVVAGQVPAGACPASTVVAVGGVGDGGANNWPPGAADVRVRYSGVLGDIGGGVAALDGAVRDVRSGCPTTRLVLSGHSQGAFVVREWMFQHPGFPNTVAVLFGGPRAPGGPLGDPNTAGIPTLWVCNWRDPICRSQPDWSGYPGEHTLYPFHATRQLAGQTGVIHPR